MSYWSHVLDRRIGRRRALAASATLVSSAALLAACGGGEDEPKGVAGDKSGLIVPIVDTSKQAKRGGAYKWSTGADTTTFDPHSTVSTRGITGVYSNLLQLKAGHMQKSDGDVTADAAESWEWSPDGMTLTLKLRQGVAFQPIPPVNGRMLDVQDVIYTWDRYKALGVNRSQFFNSLAPDGPVTSITTPDPRTIVFKLAFPVGTFLFLLATGPYPPVLIPKESEKAFEIHRTPLGTGPWMLSEWVPSSRFVYKRHPGYYDKNVPYLDEFSQPIISEYAQGYAQFRAGNLYEWAVRAEEVLSTKREVPELSMYAADLVANNTRVEFGWKPSPPEKTPFRDERVRQAYSVALDRDAWIDTFYNVEKLRAEGLPVDTKWNTALVADGFAGWWIDPQSKDFGPNAQYFQHNLAEARKLMAAAGHANGVTVESITSGTAYGVDFPRQVEVAEGMVAEAGFKFTKTVVPFAEFGTKYRDVQGKYEGLSYRGLPGTTSDPLERLLRDLSAKIGAVTFTGFDVDGKGTYDGDPYLDNLLLKARQEADKEKRRAAVHEAQRYVAKKQYVIRFPGGASSFTLRWPAVKNYQVYRDDQRPNLTLWLDETQAPLKKT